MLQAADGSTALEVVNRHGPPELVLTDIVMPGMGGAELTRRLQARWPHLPILFMSGYAENYLQSVGAHEAEVRIIEKPFEAETLIRIVNAALRACAR